jgi:hypothetical protein
MDSARMLEEGFECGKAGVRAFTEMIDRDAFKKRLCYYEDRAKGDPFDA